MDLALPTILMLNGIAHIVLALCSLVLPKVLRWDEKLAGSDTLIRQMFWTYAVYIWGINVFFGLISMLIPEELLAGSKLAMVINLLIALYWGGRLFIQFFYFDTSEAPKGKIYRVGEWLLILLFAEFTLFYGYLTWINV